VDEVMQGIVIPGSQAVFDAVAYADGKLVRAPASDDQWNRVRMQALAVAEAGNLLLMPPRARDLNAWAAAAIAMRATAADAAKAAERRDVDGLLSAGGALYESCEACHRKYVAE
jgi:hypothetical protein